MSSYSFPNVPTPVPAGWNDPPSSLFDKSSKAEETEVDWPKISDAFNQLIDQCKTISNKNTSLQRIFDDAYKKLSPLLVSLNRDPAEFKQDGKILIEFADYVLSDDLDGMKKVITSLMKNQYSQSSSKYAWVMALKKLIAIKEAK